MAQGPTGGSATDASELERLRKKLDGFEAMGLNVGTLRELLDRDPEAFKATYMDEIRRQLAGESAPAGPPADAGTEEIEVEVTTPGEAGEGADEAELEEELELELEGAGPEEALTGTPASPEPAREATLGAMRSVGAPAAVASRPALTEARPPGTAEPPTAPGPRAPESASEAMGETHAVEEAIADEVLDEAILPTEGAGLVEESEAHAGVEDLEAEGAEEAVEAIEVVAVTPDVDALGEADGAAEEALEHEPPEGGEDVSSALDEALPGPGEPEDEGAVPSEEAPEEEEGIGGEEEGAEPEGEDEGEAEAEAEAPARLRPGRAPRRRPSKAVFAVAATALIVVGGMGFYFVVLQNTPPVASFTYGPEEPVAGQQVTFDASKSSDPDKGGVRQYRWSFGDGTTGKGRIVKHTYNTTGDKTVELTVEDAKGATARARQTLSVTPLVVRMEPPLIGDLYAYDVVAYLDVFNPEGLARYEFSLGPTVPSYMVIIKEVRARLAGDKSASVDGVGTSEDGFMQSARHDVRSETTDYDLDDVEGEVLTNQATDIGMGGSVRLTMHDQVCNQWDRSVRTEVDLQARFTVEPDFVITETDTGTFYNGLDGISTSFSLNSFLRTTQFNSEDVTEHPLVVGTGTYLWRVRGMERVDGRTAWGLHINITMSPDTLRDAGLDAFYTDVWLEPGLPLPAKSHVHTKAYSEGTTVIFDITETMSSDNRGSQPPGSACGAVHSYRVEDVFGADFAALGLVPEQGGAGGDFAFTPEEALAAARSQLPAFDAWLSAPARAQAFCHEGNYSESGVDPRWNLAFGTAGSSEHYRVSVVKTPGGLVATGASYVDEDAPRGSRSGVGTVATLSRGMRLLRNQTEVQQKAYIDGNPNWDQFNLTVGEGVPSLPLSPTSMGTQGGARYVYMLESHDGPTSAKGRYRAALDATNGQVLFSWTQKQTTAGTISNR